VAQQTLTVRKGRWLTCGIVAGPIFLATWAIQAVTRDGFDPTRHPLSLLSLGEHGWVQIANFVVCGLLYVALAAGLRQAGQGTWGPVLVACNGIGLIMAGVFTTDPGAGFPQGAPDGRPEHVSVHGILHEVGFVVATVSWIAACYVLARHLGRPWARVCRITPIVWLIIAAWPDLGSLPVRLVAATAVQCGLMVAVAAHLQRTTDGTTRPR